MTLKRFENLQRASERTILSEMLIYNINDTRKFGGCHTHLRRPVTIFVHFLCDKNTIKTECNIKNVRLYDKINLTNNFINNLHFSFKHENYIRLMLQFFWDLSWFLDGFWGAKNVKRGHNLQKSSIYFGGIGTFSS